MSKKPIDEDEDATPTVAAALAQQNALLERQVAIAERQAAIAERQEANAPPNEMGYGHPKYQDRLRAEGLMTEWITPVFQNGHLAPARGVKPETITRVAQIRPGTYLGGRIAVTRDARGRVHLHYKSSQVEDRMRMQTLVKDFDDLIAQIWTEQQPATVNG